MKEFTEEKGIDILDVLGKGAAPAIAIKMKELHNIEKDSQTVRIILQDKVPTTFVPSKETYSCIEKTAMYLIEQKVAKGLKLIAEYKATQLHAA